MAYLSGSTCAVSVVIPMYNAEQYIGECLESLLIQTFQDFEVIVVDDCSTDNSAKIVEEYAPKFEGRLMFAATKINSGGGGYVPRNVGLKLASGEYIYFVDSDDFILGTALETLYKTAKKHDADVLYTGIRYNFEQPGKVFTTMDAERSKLLKKKQEDNLSLVVDDANKNVQRLLMEGHFHQPWAFFIKRDFLLENNIIFPEIVTGGDFIWVIKVYCHAKRFLRLPLPLYFWRRDNIKSVSHVEGTPAEQISYIVSNFVAWLRAFHELITQTELLRENPAYCQLASESTFRYRFGLIADALKPLRSNEVYEMLYVEPPEGSDTFQLMVSILFSELVRWEKLSRMLQGKVSKLTNELEQLKNKE